MSRWLAALLAAAVTGAGAVTEVYEPRHRSAAELQPVAEAALAGEGTVTVDAGAGALLLTGPPAAVGRARELLVRRDRARRTVVVRVESLRRRELDAAGYRIAWANAAGAVRRGRVEPGPAAARRYRSRRGAEGFAEVRVLEGEVGLIRSGVTVPVRSRGLVGTTALVSGESGLSVRPEVLGDGRVQLEVAPFDGAVDRGGRVAATGAGTTLVVRPGELVALAGLGASGPARGARTLSSAEVRSAHEETVLLLRVELE